MLKHLMTISCWVLILSAMPSLAATEPTADFPDTYYEQWLLQVAPLIDADERQVFSNLASDDQREAFIEAFWRSRDAQPETPFNEHRERYDRNVQAAWNGFADLRDERAMMTLLHGWPRYTHLIRCELLQPLHLFYYPRTLRRPEPFTALFTLPNTRQKHFKLWPASENHTFLVRDFDASGLPLAEMLDRAAESGCFTGQEQLRGFLEGALMEGIDWSTAQRYSTFPKAEEDWLATFVADPAAVDAESTLPDASLQVAFPARQGTRTILQGLMKVPRGDLMRWLGDDESSSADSSLATSFLLTGTLDHLAIPTRETPSMPRQLFRQRFHLQGEASAEHAQADSAPQSFYFYRDLVPGTYQMALRLQDPAGRTLLRDFRRIEVPLEPNAEALPLAPGAVEITPENLALLANRPTLQIVPLPRLQVGPTAVDVLTSGEGIASLRFDLDGQRVGVDTEPPWGLEIDLGEEPRPHRLEVAALNAVGDVLTRDELRLNTGAHHFSIRLLEPSMGATQDRFLWARAAVEVPASSHLDRVEIFLEETLVATLFQPPFVQMLTLDTASQASYVKAVAHLTDGQSTSDLVVVNVPGEVDEIDVREVELFANVFDRRRRPVNDLTVENFQVFEGGAPQNLQKVERVEDLPVHLAFLIDSSSSMSEELTLAIDSALRFFDTVLTPEDQAAVVTFNQGTRLSVPFTRDLDWLADGVSTLTAHGGTALWDSIIGTLHYFGGLEGKRALVLLSDGDDQHSRFNFDHTRDFAQRAGVAVYAISLDITWEVPVSDLPSLRGTDPTIDSGTRAWEKAQKRHRRRLERLAKDTGGLFFKIASTKTLDKALRAIEEDVRTQYLITYQSSHQGDGFRSIELKTEPQSLKVRTIGGYYP